MNLSKKQKSAVIGMILGDGYLQPTGKKNARLRLEHKRAHKDYLMWKTSLLKNLFQGEAKTLERTHPSTKRVYSYARHQSHSTPVFGRLQKLFYPNGKKRIPKNLANMFWDDIVFAIWFYDDGYHYKRDKCSYIYLGRVTRDEADIACKAIKEKFGIENRVLDKKNKGFVLYFSPTENKKIKLLLEKHHVPIMAYKIPL